MRAEALAALEQLVVGRLRNDPPVLELDDRVAMPHRGESMRDEQDGQLAGQAPRWRP